jgi:hypothetical protein
MAGLLNLAGEHEAALAAARAIEDDDRLGQTLADMAEALAGQGDYRALLEAALALKKWPRNQTVRRIVRALIETGDLARTRQLAGLLPGPLRDDVLKAMVAAYIAAGDLAAARRTAREIEGPEDRDKALKKIVLAHLEDGAPEDARPVAADIGDPNRRCRALTKIAGRLVKADRAPAAQQTLDDAWAPLAEVAGHSDWAKAAQAIGLIQVQAGLPPGDAFRQADLAAAEVRPADERIDLLLEFAGARQEAGQARAARDAIAASLHTTLVVADAFPRAQALAGIAQVQATQGAEGRQSARQTLAAASDWAGQIDEDDARIRSMRLIAVAQARAGLGDAAVDIALSLAKPQRIWALDDVAQAQAGIGEYEAALDTAGLIDAPGLKARTMQSLVMIQLAAGDVEWARRTAETMREGANKDQALNAIVAAQATFRATLAAADDIELGGQVRTETIRALTEAGFDDQAADLAGRANNADPEFLPKLALILARHGDAGALNRLLPLCAEHPGAALLATPAIAHLDPAQAAAVAEIVINHSWS